MNFNSEKGAQQTVQEQWKWSFLSISVVTSTPASPTKKNQPQNSSHSSFLCPFTNESFVPPLSASQTWMNRLREAQHSQEHTTKLEIYLQSPHTYSAPKLNRIHLEHGLKGGNRESQRGDVSFFQICCDFEHHSYFMKMATKPPLFPWSHSYRSISSLSRGKSVVPTMPGWWPLF